jgi:hypothetical protein
VSPVKYELGFYIPEDDILHSHSRENVTSYMYNTRKNGVFWVVTPCGSCKNRRFGGTSLWFHAFAAKSIKLDPPSYFGVEVVNVLKGILHMTAQKRAAGVQKYPRCQGTHETNSTSQCLQNHTVTVSPNRN